MHISLINPPLSTESLYDQWDLSGVDSISPPLGLLTLAAVLQQSGHDVSFIDAYANGLSVSETVRRVLDHDPEVVGIGATTPSIFGAAEVTREIKRIRSEIKTILGGPHISAVPRETMELFPQFDVGVIGEGEATFLELLESIEDESENHSDVAGLILRNGTSLLKTPPRKPIADLDSLPMPAWNLLPSLYDPYRMSIVGTRSEMSTAILTSRGCPGRCSFCDTQVFGRRFRGHSAEYVLDMIEHLVTTYGVEDFLIYDDNFVVDKKRLEAICKTLIQREYNIQWSCCAHVNLVNPDMLHLMKTAGCWQIEYGIESGDPDILKRMNKLITLDQVNKALNWTKNAGIMTRGNFIFGYIGETRQSLERTIEYILEIELDYFQQTFLTPYPGSEVYKIASEYGEVDLDWKQMNNMSINFIPKGLTQKDLVDFSKTAFRKFYLRPRIILTFLKTIRSPVMAKRYAKALWAFLITLFR